MPIKIGSDYEVPRGRKEQIAVAQKNNVQLDNLATDNEFNSSQITIEGKRYTRRDGMVNRYRLDRITFDAGREILGLYCPDCGAQAFKTDHPKVAVCGDYPGWYFFYRRVDQDIKPSAKLVLRNGELVEETEHSKEEASF